MPSDKKVKRQSRDSEKENESPPSSDFEVRHLFVNTWTYANHHLNKVYAVAYDSFPYTDNETLEPTPPKILQQLPQL